MKVDTSRLKLILTAFLLLAFLYVSNPGEVLRQLAEVSPLHYLAGLLVFSTVYPLNGLRWKIMTEKAVELDLLDSTKIIGISYGLNKILPLNSGDLARSKITEQYTEVDTHGSVLGIVALERLTDIIAVSLILLLTVFLSFPEVLAAIEWVWIPLAVSIAALLTLYLLEDRMKDMLEALPEHITPTSVRGFLSEALEGFNSLDRRQYAWTCLLTSTRWILNIAAFYIVAASAGHPISLWTAGLLTGVMSLISSMPITPAGAGIAEVSASGLLVFTGFEVSAAATIVILQRSLGVLFMGAVGLALINLEDFDIEKFRNR